MITPQRQSNLLRRIRGLTYAELTLLFDNLNEEVVKDWLSRHPEEAKELMQGTDLATERPDTSKDVANPQKSDRNNGGK